MTIVPPPELGLPSLFLSIKIELCASKITGWVKNISQQSFTACRLTLGLNLTWQVGGINRVLCVVMYKASG